MAKQPKGTVEHIDQKTGEVTYVAPPPIEDAEIVPESETRDAATAAPNGETAEEFQDRVEEHLATAEAAEAAGETIATDVEEGLAPPERIHAYDAGEFHPELHKLMGNARDFMLDRIRNNWKPWQQMTVDDQQQLVNAVEQQARDMIRGTVRALNDFEWPHCMVTLGQVNLMGSEKGIVGKITAPMVTENLDFLGQNVEKRVMLVATDAETFFGADRIKYDGRGSQMDLPLGGSVRDVEAGSFAAEEEALRAPVLDGPEPDPLAPEEGEEAELEAAPDGPQLEPAFPTPDEGEEPPPGFTWPDDEQLGGRDDTLPGEA